MGDVDGDTALFAALRAQVDAIRAVTPDGLGEAGHYLEGAIKITLTTTSHARGTRTPSAPGEPPSLITGHLRGSVLTGEPVGGGDRWDIDVGPTAVYARIQELGGMTGRGHRTRLPPRPYVAPTLARARDRLRGIVAEHWEDALTG